MREDCSAVPKTVCRDCTDNAADHGAGRPSNNDPGTGAECCANGICL
jgi:hypothetical protein